MRLNQHGNATRAAQFSCSPEDVQILVKAKDVPARLAINERNMALRSKRKLVF
jgi:hypothetical protein